MLVRLRPHPPLYELLAQLVEHRSFKPVVVGSNPTEFTKVCFHELIASSTGTGKKHCTSSPRIGEHVGWNPTGSYHGHLAQLVEQETLNLFVAGSIPAVSTKVYWRIAQR